MKIKKIIKLQQIVGLCNSSLNNFKTARKLRLIQLTARRYSDLVREYYRMMGIVL